MSLRLTGSLLLLIGLLGPARAWAAVCGGLNPVLVTATPVAFGNYDAGASSNTFANGTVTVTCTVQAASTLPSFTVALSAGGAGSFNPRQMSLLQTLNYNLYTSAAYTTIWGDGTSATVTQSYATGSALSQKLFTVYGSIPKNQYLPSGIYSDTVTITVTY